MGRFLDQYSSMNAGDTIAAPLTTTPVMFGDIGLLTQNVTNPIVNLSGTIGLSVVVGSTVTINVVRGADIATDTIIYTAQLPILSGISQIVSFNAQDLEAPAAVLTQYTAFVSGTGLLGILTGTRVGPEAFWGIASASV